MRHDACLGRNRTYLKGRLAMPQHVMMLDLIDDASMINEYVAWHALGAVPDSVICSIRNSGITSMNIYRVADRLAMVIEVTEDFSFESKAASDREDPDVVAWEALMSRFQRPLPCAAPDEKWVKGELIFNLTAMIEVAEGC